MLLTLPSEHKDFVEWRQGRRQFAVWAIDLDLPVLRRASAEVREALADYWLPGYDRQPHLTVALCGFPVANPERADDYGAQRFLAQRQALIDAAPAPFCLEIGGTESFTSAAYFSVHDRDGGIAGLRRILGEEPPAAEGASFVPHVTFALYGVARPLRTVLADLKVHCRLLPFRLEVSKLAWMLYEASVIGGPLAKVCEFDLVTGHLSVMAPDRFRTAFA